ncbi:SO_0444 family Cu/Zn efflux transporter [Glaciecola sp. SC05]|uniref:SO_0444 family Cu/Zn efflux transporter n=1 Tax=Glaciecola sp. SC05 TaxID=1987355 RepID=UPI0035272AE4
MNEFSLFAHYFVALFIESAPWLLLGLLIAGVMHELVPVDILQKHMGSNSLSSITKAALIGAPLPLCSCGVIPAALGLRRSGASKSSTVSFLVATPETGVDSVSVSYALLGPVFAVVRPIAAILSAIYAGVLVKLFDKDEALAVENAPVQSDSCCNKQKTSCCETAEPSKSKSVSVWQKSLSVLSFASGKLLSDITFWLLLGLSMAALIQTFVPTDFLTQWGDGFVAMLVMALIGIPMYICATASTPIALGFLVAGLSPGAVLVFMLAGPATNVSTMGMIGKEMGKRTLALYLFAVVSAAMTLGYGLNLLWATMQWALPSSQINTHEHSAIEWLYYLSAFIMAALMLRNLLLKYAGSALRKSPTS